MTDTQPAEPTLGELLASFLVPDPAAEQARRDALAARGQYVSAWALADQLAPLFAVAPGEVFDALCTVPDNMLSLLETPGGWMALAGYLAADFHIPLVSYQPTIN